MGQADSITGMCVNCNIDAADTGKGVSMKMYAEYDDCSIYCGDVISVLSQLPAGSVSMCVTSPPYYGLRDYGIPPTVWGGDPDCRHQWGEVVKPAANGLVNNSMQGESLSDNSATRSPTSSSICSICGAWLGTLGLEPTTEQFLQNMQAVFAAVWRVLRPDGTVWLNFGDSYAGSGKGPQGESGSVGKSYWSTDEAKPGATARDGWHNGWRNVDRRRWQSQEKGMTRVGPVQGYKAKDLMMMPARLALALQAAGWWVRSDIIWHKPNPMPEAVTDRPTTSHEHVFLLAKGEKYYYDADAIRESAEYGRRSAFRGGGAYVEQNAPSVTGSNPEAGRNKRSVWTVPTPSFPEAHFATFPEALVRPCILAGSPRDGLVLDPFGGAGTTALVARQEGRHSILIEIKEDYCKIAKGRMEKQTPRMVGM